MIYRMAAGAKDPQSAGGVSGLWGMVREPDIQDVLRFLMNVGKAVRKASVTPPYG